MKAMIISFSTNPDMQSYLYNTTSELNKLGVGAVSIGSENIKIHVELATINYLVETTDRPGVSPKSLSLFIKNLKTIEKIIEDYKPDIIHFISKHTWNYILIKMIKRKYKNIKIVHTVHDPIGHGGESIRRKVIFYYKTITRNVDGIIVHSMNSLKDAKENLEIKVPLFYVPLGIFLWKPYIKPNGNKNILIFGRLNAYKGLEYVPEISEKLYKLDKDIVLNIYGKTSKDIDKSLIEKITNLQNINFNDEFIPEEKMDDLIYSNDIVLITYTSISQSGVIVEAYRHSKPVIAFNIKGMDEFVINDKSGYLINNFDTTEFAKIVYETVNNSAKLNEISENAYAFGNEQYSCSEMCIKLKEFYNNIYSGEKNI